MAGYHRCLLGRANTTPIGTVDKVEVGRRLSLPHFRGYGPWINIWDIAATEFFCVSGRFRYAVSHQNGIAQIGGNFSTTGYIR